MPGPSAGSDPKRDKVGVAKYKEQLAKLRSEKRQLQADLKAARSSGASKSTRVGIRDKKKKVKAEIGAHKAKRR